MWKEYTGLSPKIGKFLKTCRDLKQKVSQQAFPIQPPVLRVYPYICKNKTQVVIYYPNLQRLAFGHILRNIDTLVGLEQTDLKIFSSITCFITERKKGMTNHGGKQAVGVILLRLLLHANAIRQQGHLEFTLSILSLMI